MDFSLTEEQRLLSETLDRCLGEEAGFDRRKDTLRSAEGWSQDLWNTLSGLGVPASVLREVDGGLGGGAVELALLCRSAGSALLLEPVTSALVGNAAFARYAGAANRQSLAAGLAEGALILVPVVGDPATSIRATATSEGLRLTGRAAVVYHAPCASHLVCAVTQDPDGAPMLVSVPTTAERLRLDTLRTMDGQTAADLTFDGVLVPDSDVWVTADPPAIEWLEDLAILALAADTLGCAERTMALTIEYLKTRQQFGGPIGRFQALQHRVVSCLSRLEELRTWLWVTAARFGGSDHDRRRSSAALKVLLAETARHLGEEAVQLHGGMGVTEEMEVSHHFRRLTAATLRYGNASDYLTRFADLALA